MKYYFMISIIVLGFISQACSPTTTLTQTTSAYKLVSPEKSRLIAKYDIPIHEMPVLKIRMSKDYLSQKVYTLHYETIRNDKKPGQIALGLGITAASAGLVYLGSKTQAKDSSTKKLLMVGGVIGGIWGLVETFRKTPKEYWTKDSTVFNDTLYSSPEFIKSSSIKLQSTHDGKIGYLRTNDEGFLSIDVRDYYNDLDEEIELRILVSAGISKPALIKVPAGFVNRIRDNEIEAEKLLIEVESKINKKKFIEANSILKNVVTKYPYSYSFNKAKLVMSNIEGDIKEESLELVRKNFRAVLEYKVPESFDAIGITPSELSEIGLRIERMSRSSKNYVIVNGLGMALDRYEAENEFESLSNPQKIYAIFAASENISRFEGKQKWEIFNYILGIGESIAKKFSKIESRRFLGN